MTSWAEMLHCEECADRMNSFCSFGHDNLIEVRSCTPQVLKPRQAESTRFPTAASAFTPEVWSRHAFKRGSST